MSVIRQDFRSSRLDRVIPRRLSTLLTRSTPRRFFNFLLVEAEMRLGRTKLRGRPYIAFIDPINVCNLRCPLCPTGMQALPREQGLMDLHLFKHSVDEVAPWAYEVTLYNWGEPLLHKDIFEMIRYCTDKKLSTSISSNFNVLRPGDADRLIDSGLDYLTVSIDGASPETYTHYRVRGDFNKVLNNVRSLVARRRERGARTPAIEWQFIVMKHNQHEIELAKQMAEEIGVDFINFVPVALPFGISAERQRELGPQWFSDVPGFHFADSATGWTVTKGPWRRLFWFDRLFGGRASKAGDQRQQGALANRCYHLYRSVTVNPGGGVAPCCIVYDQKYDTGNIRAGMANLWNNEAYVSARAEFNAGETPTKRTICTNCNIFAKPARKRERSQKPAAVRLAPAPVAIDFAAVTRVPDPIVPPVLKRSAVTQGVVLAAGKGTRMHAFSRTTPKPLQPICNKPIMQYQLEAMQRAGITDVAIVVGPNGEAIRSRLGDGSKLGLRLQYVEDPEPQGIASSLARAESSLTGPFAVFLGDIFLALDDLAPALARVADGAAATIATRRDTPEAVRRNFAVVADPSGRARRVVEKPTEPVSDLKGCGVYVFDGDIFDAIRRTPRSPLRGEYELTDALQILIDGGRPVYAENVVRWDVNVTYPEDLLTCNLRQLREQGSDFLVGDSARVSPEVRLVNSIVGDRAIIDVPVTLRECLVLPDTHLTSVFGAMTRSIFAGGLIWGSQGSG